MLSILIPVFNYNVAPLVDELQKQCSAVKDLAFEILVMDDGSKYFQTENQRINNLRNCVYTVLSRNSGLAHTRNQLIQAAKFEWLLLLDSDIFPTNKNFISNYLQQIKLYSHQIYFGGICYQPSKPPKHELLRWVYGREREEKTAKQRTQARKPYVFLSSNTLFAKQVFREIRYDDTIVQYGYEDLLFSKHAFEKGFTVKHIDNAVWHMKLDSSQEYLQKVQLALQTLQTLILQQKLDWSATGITEKYHQLRKYKLLGIVLFISRVLHLEKRLEKRLLSDQPQVKHLDWYRLLYFARTISFR